MGNYPAARAAANESHAARQRKWGGGVSDEKQDRKEVASGVHKHERNMHKGEKETKLRNGGAVAGFAGGGRRLDRKGKGKTTVNIVLGGQGQQGDPQREQMAHQQGMQQGAQMGAKMAAAKLAGAGGGPGGPPPGMPPGGGAPPPGMAPPGGPPRPPIAGMGPGPGGPPPMMPPRARGGRSPRALGESMKYGAGSGEGRLEKEKMAEKEMRHVE